MVISTRTVVDPDFSYFDEAYFEGGNKGTAYLEYRENASKSPAFSQIAKSIKFIFKPVRCLEIGCATGAVVKHLNELGMEAHGIDVSEWAVENRLHSNVIQAPASQLPYPDGHFDLVYSVHAMEHIPAHLKDASFREIARVARGGVQFHMLPLIGDGPYTGDPELHVQALQADPTHALLHTRAWWIREWGELEWSDLGINIVFDEDTAQFELSGCQFSLSDGTPDPAVTARAFEWNRKVTQRLFARRGLSYTLNIPTGDEGGRADQLRFPEEPEWRDLNFDVADELELSEIELFGTVDVEGDEPINLRIAIICNYQSGDSVLEYWSTFKPGINFIQVLPKDMNLLRGNLASTVVSQICFGGAAAQIGVAVTLVVKKGAAISRLSVRAGN